MKKKSDVLLVVLLAITLAIASSCNSAPEKKKITAPVSSVAAVVSPQKTIAASNGNTGEKHYYAWGSTGKERICPDYPNGTDLQKSRLVVMVGQDGKTTESTEYEWVCHGYY